MAEPIFGEVPEVLLDVPEDVYASWSPSSSPDGQNVAFVSDRGGEPAVWIEGASLATLHPLAARIGRVSSVHWSPDGAWLACVVDAPGSTRTEVWAVRPDGRDPQRVAGVAPGTAVLGSGTGNGWTTSSQLMVTETVGGVSTCLLARLDGGPRSVLASGPLLRLLDAQPCASAAGGVRALVRAGSRGQRWLAVADAAGSTKVDFGPGPGFVDQGFLSPDGETVYGISNIGRDFAALVAVPLSGGSARRPLRVLAAREDAELQRAEPAHDGECAVLVWNVYGGRSAVSLIELEDGSQQYLPVLPREVVDDCRLRPDGRSLLMTAEDWADPQGVWSVDTATFEAVSLSQKDDGTLRGSRGASAPTVRIADLVSPDLHRFSARDGLELTGWLYRPDPLELAAPGPLPTVLYLHGGPESQERPVYNSLYQSLVAAGIAVFALNFRGSSGFGRAFQAADDLEKRFGAITDVADAAEHLVAAGVAAPGRIGCMGRSYGGYLTLAALTWHPELFAAGVDVCGMADFATFYEHTEPWIGDASVTEYGHPQRDAALLRELSPIHRIDRLTAPLLIVHGTEDTNVPVFEATQVDQALTQRGVEHRLMMLAGEGHDFLATQNRVAVVQAAVEWLSRHLDR